MSNPFNQRTPALSGPATDLLAVTPSDSLDLPHVAISLYVQTGGAISFVSASGHSRSVTVADFSLLPVGVQRVNQTGTTATGIHALVLA